jgi:class 3 adenylate cyclase/pimeloyl-ACP methyl ester carboxylesterase
MFLHRLGSFTRIIAIDRRGAGASDPLLLDAAPSWERWVEDATAVLDEVGATQVAVFGWADAGPTAILFAATQPARTQALILANAAPPIRDERLGPHAIDSLRDAGSVSLIEFMAAIWGTEEMAHQGAPDAARDPAFVSWMSKNQRLASSPQQVGAYLSWLGAIDITPALSALSAPTLILHREDVEWIPIDTVREVAESIRGARFVAVPGADMTPYTEPSGEIVAEIEEFLTGIPSVGEPERILATVVFSDIVGSTERAVELGDRRWRNLLATHDALSTTIVEQHHGRLVSREGDGFLATFDGPGKAIRCSLAVRDALAPIGIKVRVGIHTGEIELRGRDMGGIGVHLAARVREQASPGEVLTSGAVPLLVAGSGIDFMDRGEHELKGLPGAWRLFAVTA